MSRIQLLPEEVASQVAAGEVIERPAAVVKELVENSIDAGSSKIEVIVRRGGISMIKVIDNGMGMDRDDALLCLERHATSKIRTGHDLARISTLGFRGEALPSIASVSRFRLVTCEHKATTGTEVVVSGGKIEHVRDSGGVPGTQIEVRSLFYNLPARRKFLRAENTESSHIQYQLHLHAIGHPNMAFVYVNDERLIYQLPPATNLTDRIRDLSGTDLINQLLEVSGEFNGISVSGFIGKAGVSRSTKSQQVVFLNGRAIENSTINFALREGYHTALMKGQFPITFLFINMDPAAVDVNVHPSKREVRFRDPAMIRESIVECIRKALETGRENWEKNFQAAAALRASPAILAPLVNKPDIASPPPGVPDLPPLIPISQQVTLRKDWSMLPEQKRDMSGDTQLQSPPSEHPAPTSTKHSENFKILGVLGKLYVLMENESGLVLVDQHAAHERVLFEELRRRMEQQGVPGQRLLIPQIIQLNPRDSDWILENLETLQKMGIGLEQFGPGTFKIDSLPQFVRTKDPLQLIRDVIDELREVSSHSSKMRLGEDVIATTVCRHAVKANDYLRESELVRLIQDLLSCELPYCCPHGRPTMIQISYLELEKKFGRKS